MARMGVYDQIKSAFQDIVAPDASNSPEWHFVHRRSGAGRAGVV